MKLTAWSEQLREHIAASELAQRAWTRYEAAAPREQLALKILGGFLGGLLIFGVVIAPLHHYHAQARAAYREQLDTLAWMQANRGAINPGDDNAARPAGTSLLALAGSTARSEGIAFKRTQPVGDHGLSLWLDNVAFNRVVAWLGRLQRSGVAITDVDATRRDQPGMVDVRVTLQE